MGLISEYLNGWTIMSPISVCKFDTQNMKGNKMGAPTFSLNTGHIVTVDFIPSNLVPGQSLSVVVTDSNDVQVIKTDLVPAGSSLLQAIQAQGGLVNFLNWVKVEVSKLLIDIDKAIDGVIDSPTPAPLDTSPVPVLTTTDIPALTTADIPSLPALPVAPIPTTSSTEPTDEASALSMVRAALYQMTISRNAAGNLQLE